MPTSQPTPTTEPPSSSACRACLGAGAYPFCLTCARRRVAPPEPVVVLSSGLRGRVADALLDLARHPLGIDEEASATFRAGCVTVASESPPLRVSLEAASRHALALRRASVATGARVSA